MRLVEAAGGHGELARLRELRQPLPREPGLTLGGR